MLCAMQNFFHAHLEDHVGMGADPGAARCHVTQHRVEHGPCLPFMDRIDPDEHPIDRQKLFAHFVDYVVRVNRGLRVNAERGQLLEYAMKAIVLRCCRSPRLTIAAP